MGEASWRRHHGGVIIKIIIISIWEAFRKHLGGTGGIWEASGGIWRHLEASGRHLEASGRHLGGIWEVSGGIWKHLEASGGIWRHLDKICPSHAVFLSKMK